MIAVELPWPDRVLHPNARPHWAAKAKAAKAARLDAAWCAKAAGVRKSKDPDAELSVTATFFPPDRRRRDVDNLLASIKSHLDGIADVIGVDDHKWQIVVKMAKPCDVGVVRIEIEETEA